MFAQHRQKSPLPARVTSGQPTQTKKFIIIGIFFLLLLAASTASSQPYYFVTNDTDNAIYKLNLATGQLTLLVPNGKIIGDIFMIQSDAQQQWLYAVNGRGGSATALNLSDTSVMISLPPDNLGVEVDGIVYMPHQNKLYITWGVFLDDVNQVRCAAIYNGTTFVRLDTLNFGALTFVGQDDNVVSPCGDSVYVIEGPRSGTSWKTDIFSSVTDSVVSTKGANDFAPSGVYKYAADFRRGIFLYGYYYPDSLTGVERTYNTFTNTFYPSIACMIPGQEFLSANAKYVIHAEKTSPADYSGSAYVFATATGKLTQKKYFPPGGQFYVFDTVPDTVYYVIDDSSNDHYVYKIGLSAPPTPVEDLLDTLTSLRMSVGQNGRLGNNAFGSQLDSLLTKARTDLLRGDSLSCAKFVKTFQDTVRYYLLNPTSGKFVKRMGDKQLYSNAQYILDALPPLR
jgi:hypothetical protein